MSVKIRFQRIGRKNKAFYRIVVAEESSKLNGKVIASIGIYDPKKNPTFLKVDDQKLQKWLSLGAQPSESIRKLLKITN